MKASVLVKVCALLPVLASGFVEPQASGQTWVPIGPPPWMNTNALSMRFFQTAGGITYFTHTSKLPVCYRVTAGAVTRTGTKLAQIINLEQWTGPCAACVCYNIETHVSVLGALPPDNYMLNIYSWDQSSQTNQFFTQLPFTVAFPITPMLTPSLDTVRLKDFNLRVAGISNVQYVVQASVNLTNWASIATNNGGPFVLSEPWLKADTSIQATNRFYRTVFPAHSVVSHFSF